MSEDLYKERDRLRAELYEIEKEIDKERSCGSSVWNVCEKTQKKEGCGEEEKEESDGGNGYGVFGLPDSIGGGVGFFS